MSVSMRFSAKRRLKPDMKHQKHENFTDRTHHLCKSDYILVSFWDSGHVRNSNVHRTITMSVTWVFLGKLHVALGIQNCAHFGNV